MTKTKKSVITFLAITFAISSVFYYLIIAAGVLEAAYTSIPAIEPKAAHVAEPSPIASAMPIQAVVHNSTGDEDFKEFVDNHVRSTTKFQSADDLLKNSKAI